MSRKKSCLRAVELAVVVGCLLVPSVMAGTNAPLLKSDDGPILFSTWPGNGVYWNERKLMDLPVLLFLHYHFKLRIPVKVRFTANVSDDVGRVVFYIDGAQQFIDTEPPYQWTLGPIFVRVPPRGQGALVFNVSIDNVNYYRFSFTVYRLRL